MMMERQTGTEAKTGVPLRYVEAEEFLVEINYVFDEILACVTGEHWPRLGLKERLQTLASALESLHMWKEGIEKRDSVTVDECRAWLERKIEETQTALDRLRPVAEKFKLETGAVAGGPKQPTWDRERRKLFFAGQEIKSVRSLKVAKNVVLVLDTFELDGWPHRIDSPLPDDSKTLHETIDSLNKNLKVIRFRSDGDGEGIMWETR